jgi:hypothetical protein
MSDYPRRNYPSPGTIQTLDKKRRSVDSLVSYTVASAPLAPGLKHQVKSRS